MTQRTAILIIPEKANDPLDYSTIFACLPEDSKIVTIEDARSHGFFGMAYTIKCDKFKEHSLGSRHNYIHPEKDENGLFFIEKDNLPFDVTKTRPLNFNPACFHAWRLGNGSETDDLKYVPLPPGISVDYLKTSCNHQWKMYHGIIDNFEYCTICDEKRK